MRGITSLLPALLLTGLVGFSAAPVWAQEGVLLKVRAGQTNYCHMKFPAIREETLGWDRPVLQGKGTADIIDYYGPCDHDPLGEDEIFRQMRTEAERETSQ